MTALKCKKPDKVPYMHSVIDTSLQQRILGEDLHDYVCDNRMEPSLILEPEAKSRLMINYPINPKTAKKLKLDAIGVKILPPIYAQTKYQPESGHMIEKGLVDSWEALEKIKLPDPDDDKAYGKINSFIEQYKEDYAMFCDIRLGISLTLLSMGYDNFSYKLFEDRELVKEVLKKYTKWNIKVIKNLMQLKIDFLWAFDDLAFKAGPLFSSEVWNEIFMPYLKELIKEISVPWIFHSDGNLIPILEDILQLGMNGIHPLEPNTMDLGFLKQKYGRILCLVGNIDIDRYLTNGTEREVEQEVKRKIGMLGEKGGYIISDSNSLPYYCNPKCVLALSKAVEKYRNIY